MDSIKNCWIYITITLCTFKFCKSWTFEIKRYSSRNYDVIPNDFGINPEGRWIKLKKCNKDCINTTGLNTGSCLARKKCCSCRCPYYSSTFRMGATAHNSSCVRNEVMRSSAGCEFIFQTKGSSKDVLSVLELDESDRNKSVIKTPAGMTQSSLRCNVKGKAEYWDYGEWKNVNETDLFTVYNRYQSYFKWKTTDKYEGRIMRQSLQCNDTSSGRSLSSCIIFKVSGTLQYTIKNNPKPTSKAPPPSSTGTTTQKLSQTTPTTGRSSSQSTPKRLTTSFSVQSTTVSQPTHMTSTTENIKTVAPTYKRSSTFQTLYSTKYASTTEKIPTEASKMPVTEVTDQPTTETEVEPGKKGARGASGDSDNSNNTLMITAIGAAGAIICVIIICIFLWFMMKRKRNNRSNEAYSTDMTVITNGTGMNNSSAAPTLKNPVYDNAGYCEPTEKQRPYPKQLPRLGNPVYDKAIVVNSNNNGHQNIQHPSHKPKSKKDKNHYDNKDEDEAYENPGYQDLIAIKPVKNSASDNSTYDNAYAEPEKPVYEQLTKDSVYQPLVHNRQHVQKKETPEYLTLLDESSSPGEQSMPEYLTLVNDEDNQTQPEVIEYDYAFVDGEEKRTTLKAPSTNVPGMSLHSPPVYDVLEDPNDQGPPTYHVLEDPSDQGPPLYDVLEDPNDQGPPTYDVLEDPSDQGPPLYDVLEDPNDQGTPTYDVLEDPSDQGTPVYDVLEGPDSGDDYLIPIEGAPSK